MSGRVVWLVVRPGYGDFDGTPEEIWQTRTAAQTRIRELNAQYDRPRGTLPVFRLRRAEVRSS